MIIRAAHGCMVHLNGGRGWSDGKPVLDLSILRRSLPAGVPRLSRHCHGPRGVSHHAEMLCQWSHTAQQHRLAQRWRLGEPRCASERLLRLIQRWKPVEYQLGELRGRRRLSVCSCGRLGAYHSGEQCWNTHSTWWVTPFINKCGEVLLWQQESTYAYICLHKKYSWL